MTNNELPKDTIGYITYWCNKYKSHITRRGKHDEKSQIKTNKQGKEYYVYTIVINTIIDVRQDIGKRGHNANRN